MQSFHRILIAAGLVVAAGWACAPVRAQSLLNRVQLVSSPTAGAVATPATQTFTISTPGSYTVTLTDSSPVPLASLQLAIATAGATLLHLSAAGTSSTGSITLQPGIYFEQVLASASNELGGSFSAAITTSSGAAVPVTAVDGAIPADVFVGAVTGSVASPPVGQSVLQTQFTVTNADTYQLTWADLGFPAAMQPESLDIAIWNEATPAQLLYPQAGQSAGVSPGTLSLGNLVAGTYELVVIAQAAAPAYAGLYTLEIGTGAPGGDVLARAVPVGTLPPASTLGLQSSATLTLTLQDMIWPTALAASSLQAVIVQGASVLQGPVGAGSHTIPNVAAGSVQLFVTAQPGAGGEGSYSATIDNGSTALLDVAQPVTDGSHPGFAYTSSIAAGAYQLGITDLAEPAALGSLSASAEQNGARLGSVSMSGAAVTLSPQPQTGLLNIVAFAAPGAQAGLFALSLTANPSGTLAYQTTQGVGADFTAQQFSIATAGSYQMSITDLGFPASLGTLRAILTSGAQTIGHGDGSGSFSFQAAPGNYTLNVLAVPGTLAGGAASDHGLYGAQLETSASPPATPGPANSGGGGGFSVADLAVLMLVVASRLRSRAGACAWRRLARAAAAPPVTAMSPAKPKLQWPARCR